MNTIGAVSIAQFTASLGERPWARYSVIWPWLARQKGFNINTPPAAAKPILSKTAAHLLTIEWLTTHPRPVTTRGNLAAYELAAQESAGRRSL